jgi:hypothetical protein
MGLIDGQIGDRTDASTTDVHIFEFHQGTALTIIIVVLLLAALVGGLWWYCRKRYRQKIQSQGRHLALTYQGCTCGAAMAAATMPGGSRSTSRSPTRGRLHSHARGIRA